jgi:hypothetical protein
LLQLKVYQKLKIQQKIGTSGDISKPPPRTASFGILNFFIIIHAAGYAKADIVFP